MNFIELAEQLAAQTFLDVQFYTDQVHGGSYRTIHIYHEDVKLGRLKANFYNNTPVWRFYIGGTYSSDFVGRFKKGSAGLAAKLLDAMEPAIIRSLEQHGRTYRGGVLARVMKVELVALTGEEVGIDSKRLRYAAVSVSGGPMKDLKLLGHSEGRRRMISYRNGRFVKEVDAKDVMKLKKFVDAIKRSEKDLKNYFEEN